MSVDIKVEIDSRKLDRYLALLVSRGKDVRPALKKASVWMYRSFDKNFRAEGRPRKWQKLAPSTVFARRKGSSRILQDTGRLRMSVMSKSASGNIYQMRHMGIKMGTRLKVAQWHQWGTNPYDIVPKTAKWLRFIGPTGNFVYAKKVRHPGLPARPFVMFQDEDIAEIESIFASHAIGE